MLAVETYRDRFKPGRIDEPYLMLGVSVLCAETDDHAQWLAGSSSLSFIRMRTGTPGRLPTPEEAAAYEYSPQELALLETRRGAAVVGSPETVRAELAELVERTGADELMITTSVHSHAERVRSYELLAEVVELEPLEVGAPRAGAEGS